MDKIGLGGGCHWCTEAVFQNLFGVTKVEQGYIASKVEPQQFCEAVIVHFDVNKISLFELIDIHINTHNSSSTRSIRRGYRSAIYVFDSEQEVSAKKNIEDLGNNAIGNIVTQVLPFQEFKPSQEKYQNYYLKDPLRPFCKTYITPKLSKLEERYPTNLSRRIGHK